MEGKLPSTVEIPENGTYQGNVTFEDSENENNENTDDAHNPVEIFFL